VHLAMEAKGYVEPKPAKQAADAPED
jgi:hypothetical protein